MCARRRREFSGIFYIVFSNFSQISSWIFVILNVKSFMLIAGDVVPRFRIGIYQKDLHKTLLTGKDLGVLLPMNRLVQQMLRWLINDGKRDLNHSAIANFIEDMANEAVDDR